MTDMTALGAFLVVVAGAIAVLVGMYLLTMQSHSQYHHSTSPYRELVWYVVGVLCAIVMCTIIVIAPVV